MFMQLLPVILATFLVQHQIYALKMSASAGNPGPTSPDNIDTSNEKKQKLTDSIEIDHNRTDNRMLSLWNRDELGDDGDGDDDSVLVPKGSVGAAVQTAKQVHCKGMVYMFYTQCKKKKEKYWSVYFSVVMGEDGSAAEDKYLLTGPDGVQEQEPTIYIKVNQQLILDQSGDDENINHPIRIYQPGGPDSPDVKEEVEPTTNDRIKYKGASVFSDIVPGDTAAGTEDTLGAQRSTFFTSQQAGTFYYMDGNAAEGGGEIIVWEDHDYEALCTGSCSCSTDNYSLGNLCDGLSAGECTINYCKEKCSKTAECSFMKTEKDSADEGTQALSKCLLHLGLAADGSEPADGSKPASEALAQCWKKE